MITLRIIPFAPLCGVYGGARVFDWGENTMKKLISGISALLTAAMLIAPMSAFADTEIKQNSTTKSGTMTATYDVSAKYTVTIPAGVTLSSTDAVPASIEASDVMLESGQKIKVSLTQASNTTSGATFHAKNDKGDSIATYTISKGETAVAVGDVVAEFTENGEQSLTFSKAEGATHAGTHTETLTFGIAVEKTMKTLTVGTQTIQYYEGDTWKTIIDSRDDMMITDTGAIMNFDSNSGYLGAMLRHDFADDTNHQENYVYANDPIDKYSIYLWR